MDWTIAKSGIFNCAKTWEAIRSKQPLVDWWRMVWHSLLSQGMHSSVAWLFRNRLTTHRLLDWGIKVIFCMYFKEYIGSRDHLNFECSFPLRVWHQIEMLCLIRFRMQCWSKILQWGVKALKGKGLESVICKVSWA